MSMEKSRHIYQNGYTKAFHNNYYHSIDQAYVFAIGVSLTCGQNSQKHIWTFAGASDEAANNAIHKCSCINPNLDPTSLRIPNFIGSDYFCDAALSNPFYFNTKELYPSDPLWDGQGCGSSNTCCSVADLCTNSPPWFNKHLTSSTTDDV